ncbi:SOS response-associated peptidase [Asticcacaulis sp. AND118]|uniref:SOS response-associated peptidase n=1 Tax=Asticcacaulis sp. AND118 TaxID=2840468 RepID=UPI001D0008BE|nr:SOS response-associated peptidase [Asticcacaulis sp. AND118]UDF04538.1 SOS response-associated peptidase [Asticcacaulis sp. AND118]
MCGQFLALKEWRDFLKSLGIDDEVIAEVLVNVVKPTLAYPIITAGPNLMTARWGLIPGWATDAPKASTFNARIETAAEKPSFRDAFARRHALVPVAGFYEWSGPSNPKRRHRITRKDNEPLVFAGLWEGDTFTILTRAARAQMAALHDREPVVVGRRQWKAWLDNTLFDPALPPEDFFHIADDDTAPMQDSLF